MYNDKTFCPLPWNSINLRNNGDLRICCNTNSYSQTRGILYKDDGVTPYNAGRDDWNEARNATILKEVRKTILKGEWHSECERCRQEEINGIRSRREYERADWESNFGDFIDYEKAYFITDSDGTIDTEEQPINFIDIRYGNFCNLKCRMCGPTDSHQWYGDFVELEGVTSYEDTHQTIQLYKNDNGRWTTDQYDWFQNNDIYWKNFDEYASNAHKLYIVGGEPLIIEEHLQSIEHLVKSGKSKQIRLEYNSNLTTVPPKLLSLWENFKEVRIGASIDGYGDVFTYQRGANWEQVYNNLKKIEANTSIPLKGWLAFTVTPLNVFHFVEFMKWKLMESGLTRFNSFRESRPIVSHHMCHSPKYYNIKVLPMDIKMKVKEHYEKYNEWVLTTDLPGKVKNDFIKISNGVINFMMSEDYSDRWLGTFISHTKKLDDIRGNDILEIVPEYKQIFNPD